MKLLLPATALGVAVIAASVLTFGSSATAATPGVSYITNADIATPGSFGTTGWSNIGPGTLTDTPLDGLLAAANARPFYGFSSPLPTIDGSALQDVAASSYFYVSDDIDISAQISWYADLAETSEQYFYPQDDGVAYFADPSLLWRSTMQVGSISPFSFATLAQFDAEFAIDPALADASIQGVGFYNQGAPLINVYGFTAGGNQFRFTPEPVSTAPTSIGQVDFSTAGATATTTGFVPGETVSTYLNTTQSTSDPIDLVADANGAVTYTWVAPVNNMDVGTYEILFVGGTSGLLQFFDFDVTAQVGLAATGVDAIVPLSGGALLLFGGIALVVVAAKRRARV